MTCGYPPSRDHSSISQSSIAGTELATYTCKTGYSFNATQLLNAQVTITCQEDGGWEQAPQCSRKYTGYISNGSRGCCWWWWWWWDLGWCGWRGLERIP